MSDATVNRELADHLARRILLEGPLTVAAFMGDALGHPRWGYYPTRDPLGAAGDFITAPEISQMFGELLGLWCADTWMRMGGPSPVYLVELGPGRGTLMADALRALRLVPALLAAVRVVLVETSPALRKKQAATLGPVMAGMAPPRWLDSIEALPDEAPLLVLGNEFLDALPVRQVQKTAHGWAERLIDIDEAAMAAAGDGLPRFRWVLEAGRGPGRAVVPVSLQEAAVGSIYEWSPAVTATVGALAERLVRQGGAALLVDYGYAGPALGDTLQAMRAHAFVPVLDGPGTADLTAHVDFTAVAEAARCAGALACGPATQGAFLRALGIDQRASALCRTAPPRAEAVTAAHERLTADDQMGKLFKVLAFAAPGLDVSAAFAI